MSERIINERDTPRRKSILDLYESDDETEQDEDNLLANEDEYEGIDDNDEDDKDDDSDEYLREDD